MFSLFKFKVGQEQHHREAVQDRVAKGIATKCKKMQLQMAKCLQQKTEGLSGKAKRFGLVLFCLLAGGYFGFLVIDSLSDSERKPFSVTSIKTPAYAGKDAEEQVLPHVTEELYQRVQRFKMYIDSLSKNAPGRKVRDSILLSRPGLMDSILLIDHLFYAQSSKQ